MAIAIPLFHCYTRFAAAIVVAVAAAAVAVAVVAAALLVCTQSNAKKADLSVFDCHFYGCIRANGTVCLTPIPFDFHAIKLPFFHFE